MGNDTEVNLPEYCTLARPPLNTASTGRMNNFFASPFKGIPLKEQVTHSNMIRPSAQPKWLCELFKL
ncbi:hypothetical protein GZ78_02555 [Endozoicomonas numazuensis]|uniref:Uncharacterized protein n=1 Tax=Endozoicomonas numazuensis TaxID=1137799 RepID=A0A081NKH9_9GAMM|nr:hypothetical protein GZ78_02555 [Endozoicomonas numazuensis]